MMIAGVGESLEVNRYQTALTSRLPRRFLSVRRLSIGHVPIDLDVFVELMKDFVNPCVARKYERLPCDYRRADDGVRVNQGRRKIAAANILCKRIINILANDVDECFQLNVLVCKTTKPGGDAGLRLL